MAIHTSGNGGNGGKSGNHGAPNGGDPKRCLQPPGKFEPIIDRSRCEAKGPCVTSCPFDVFEISALTAEEKAGLGFLAKLKAFAHGNKQAHAVRADACQACGYCVEVCPEKAITLRLRAV